MRRFVAIGIFLVAIGIAIFSVARSTVYNECKTQYSEQTGNQQKPERHTPLVAYFDCLGPFTHENHGPITAVFTVLLGLATFLLWWATRDLVDGAERTARRQLRAYVFPDNAGFADRGSWPDTPPNAALDGFIMSLMQVKNSGQTPAYEVIHWGELDVRRIDQEDSLAVPDPLARQSVSTIPPSGFVSKTLIRAAKLSDTEINGIRAGSYGVYMWGRIEYKDAFNRDRWTNYRLRYTGAYPPVPPLTMNFCDGGNDTDEHN